MPTTHRALVWTQATTLTVVTLHTCVVMSRMNPFEPLILTAHSPQLLIAVIWVVVFGPLARRGVLWR